MDTATHTAGPWVLYSEHPSEQYVDVRLDDDNNRPVFRIKHDRTISEDEACANARLIAAAPQLLAACELVNEFLWNDKPLTADVLLRFQHVCQTAIAKAKVGA